MSALYVVNVEAAVVNDGDYLVIVRGEDEDHAPGTLAFPGGKVEESGAADDVLERALRREVREEVAVEVSDPEYVESKSFVADDGTNCVDLVYLCRHASGTPIAASPEEVAEVAWLSADEILDHPETPPWIRRSVERAEETRRELGW